MAEKNLKNKKAFDGYSDFFLAKENYSEAEGAEKLRETLLHASYADRDARLEVRHSW